MCWSGEASFGMAAIGFTGAAFEWAKRQRPSAIGAGSNWQVEGWTGHHVLRAGTLSYFSLMEMLQGFNYIGFGSTWSNEFFMCFFRLCSYLFPANILSWFMLLFYQERVV